MPNPNLSMPDQDMDFERFRSFVGEQLTRINYLFKNIEGLNIKQIQFDLDGGAFIRIDRKGITINNGTHDTFTVDINGLATLTAAIIQSATGYPKIELNSGTNLFAAYKSATDKVTLNPNLTDSPSWIFDNGSATANIGNVLSIFWINCITGNMQVSSNENLNIKAGLGGTGTVNFDSWTNVKNAATSQTLQSALDAKANNSLINGTVYVATTPGGAANTPITFTNGVRTG